jgi:hypothetical protein
MLNETSVEEIVGGFDFHSYQDGRNDSVDKINYMKGLNLVDKICDQT